MYAPFVFKIYALFVYKIYALFSGGDRILFIQDTRQLEHNEAERHPVVRDCQV
jgi:hypothetical protein